MCKAIRPVTFELPYMAMYVDSANKEAAAWELALVDYRKADKLADAKPGSETLRYRADARWTGVCTLRRTREETVEKARARGLLLHLAAPTAAKLADKDRQARRQAANAYWFATKQLAP